jgi:hypothetical protein
MNCKLFIKALSLFGFLVILKYSYKQINIDACLAVGAVIIGAGGKGY